jgi:putative permease
MTNIARKWLDRLFADPHLMALGASLLVGFLLIYYLWSMLAPVIAGIVIAYLLEGVVGRLQKIKMPRLLAVTIVCLVFWVGLIVLFIGLLPILFGQIGQLIVDLPQMIATAKSQLATLPESYPDFVTHQDIEQIFGFISQQLSVLGRRAVSLSLASVKGVITGLVYLILVPLLVFFFLKDKNKILDWLAGIMPRERRLTDAVLKDVNLQIANYVRGKVWEIFIVWGVSFAVFTILDLQYATLLSLLVGLSVLIPYIGATFMFLPVTLMAYFQWGWSPHFGYAVGAYLVIQFLDGNLLAPLLLSEVVNMHPVAVIVSVLVFGGLWGLWGPVFRHPAGYSDSCRHQSDIKRGSRQRPGARYPGLAPFRERLIPYGLICRRKPLCIKILSGSDSLWQPNE